MDGQQQDNGRVVAVVATLGVVDHDGDIVMPGSFDSPCRVVLSDWEHASWSSEAPPIGVGECYEDGDYLIFEGEFFATERAQSARNMIRDLGDRCEWSWGFLVDHESTDREGNRCLDKVTIYEVSPVMRAAGIGTSTRIIKSGTGPALERKAIGSATGEDHAEIAAWVERERRRRGEPDGPSVAEIRRNLARNTIDDGHWSDSELADERAHTRHELEKQRLQQLISDKREQLRRREELRALRAELDAVLGHQTDSEQTSSTEKSGQMDTQVQQEKPSEASTPEQVDARVKQIIASLVAELEKLEKLLGGGETDQAEPEGTKYDRDDFNEYMREYQQNLSSSQRDDRYESQQRWREDNIRA